MAKLFLGLDSSTQSLSAVIIDLDTHTVVYEHSLNFDRALPEFKTRNGVLPHLDPLVKHSTPLLWAAALDRLLAEMKKAGAPLGEILAIGGSGQQHGSIYLNQRAEKAIAKLNPKKSLIENLRGVFSRPTSPIWMDSSTAKQCGEIRQKLGGVKAAATATGSDIFERFTGPQIRKFYQASPAAYAKTSHIALVSSFMASLLAGKIAPVDFGDGRWHEPHGYPEKNVARRRAGGDGAKIERQAAAARGIGSSTGPDQLLLRPKIRAKFRSTGHRVDRC